MIERNTMESAKNLFLPFLTLILILSVIGLSVFNIVFSESEYTIKTKTLLKPSIIVENNNNKRDTTYIYVIKK